jgi:glycosyltransferase involved in cell wall biosynthesis
MANGLPIISTDRCIAALELVDSNGIIVPVDDIKKLQDAISELMNDDELRYSYSKESLRLIQGNVVDKICEEHNKCINKVLEEKYGRIKTNS